jgi:hypothetical protein
VCSFSSAMRERNVCKSMPLLSWFWFFRPVHERSKRVALLAVCIDLSSGCCVSTVFQRVVEEPIDEDGSLQRERRVTRPSYSISFVGLLRSRACITNFSIRIFAYSRIFA